MQNINNFYNKKYKYVIVAFYILYVTICILYNLEIIKSYPINKISLWFNRINTEFSLGYISVALFALVFKYLNVNPLVFFVAYIAAQMVFWFAPLIIVNRPKRD